MDINGIMKRIYEHKTECMNCCYNETSSRCIYVLFIEQQVRRYESLVAETVSLLSHKRVTATLDVDGVCDASSGRQPLNLC